MWSLLSLLLFTTLVAAAPRHGLQHRQWGYGGRGRHTTTVVAQSSKTPVPSSTSPLPLWPSTAAATNTPPASSSVQYVQPSPTAGTGYGTGPGTGSGTGSSLIIPHEDERISPEYAGSICHKCHTDRPIIWPLPTSTAGVAMPMPLDENRPFEQLSIFPRPEGSPGKVSIMNYCSYTLHYKHYSNAGFLNAGSIAAGGSCVEDTVGTVYKVGKSTDSAGEPVTPVQIEYSADGFYDLSLIDCLHRVPNPHPDPNDPLVPDTVRTADTSGCAGHEHGLQLSVKGGRGFQCAPGTWCDDQAYLYEENLCKDDHPNTSGDIPGKGLVMEFCAELKP